MIETSNWKEFRVGDLFDVSRPSSRSSQSYNEGNIPFVASGNFNNGGIAYLQPKDDNDYDEGGCITVSAVDGYAFYQKDKFLGRGGAGSSIMMLRNDNLNELNGKYICTIIRKACNDWKYSNMGNKDKLADTLIWLPITSTGEPDWNYMESYMKAVMEESEKSLENLIKADGTKHLIDVSEWGEFSCKELFECKNTGNILARDVINGSGDTPYVTASGYNNGVVAYIDASNYEIIKGHCILVGGKTFTITYQKDDFVSNDSHNFTIRVKDYDISDLNYLYLVSMIYTYFGQKYSWNDAVTKDKLFNESIPLPITSTGEPDWQYMEDYMQRIMDKSEQIISDLQIGA